jgi:uncharacterized protein (TIGR04255 family)
MAAVKAPYNYSHAPITEAVIDIQTIPASDVAAEALAEVFAGQEEMYPNLKQAIRFESKVSVGNQAMGASTTQSKSGYAVVSKDGKQICQIRIDGFTFSRLAPYQTWENFRKEAQRLWELYKSVARPRGLTRIAVRFVNKLNLPFPFEELGDYLNIGPSFAEGLPDLMSGFLLQVKFPVQELKAELILTTATLEIQDQKFLPVILDIDLFRVQELPVDEQELWDLFEQFRGRKNKVFEACITDRMRELIR